MWRAKCRAFAGGVGRGVTGAIAVAAVAHGLSGLAGCGDPRLIRSEIEGALDPWLRRVGIRYGDTVMVPSNQLLPEPVAQRIELSGRPVDMTASPRGDRIAVLFRDTVRGSSVTIFSAAGEQLGSMPVYAPSLLGIAFSADGQRLAVSQLGAGLYGVLVLDLSGGARLSIPLPDGSVPAGLSFSDSGAYLYVALNRHNAVARVDLDAGTVAATVAVGVAPIGVATTGDRLWVTNWGGRRPQAAEPVESSSGTLTLVDPRGVAASGTVSVIELDSLVVGETVPVGLHPAAVQVSPDRQLVAVANATSDTVTLLDAGSRPVAVVDTLALPAVPDGFLGSSPTALAFSPSGQRLYVALGGNDAVAMLERAGASYELRGFVPTDWYPLGVAVGGDPAETVFVSNGKGLTGRWSGGQGDGTLSLFPGGRASADLSETNLPFRRIRFPETSPATLGDLGVRHVFLVIKENRTYDQVLGDLGRGDGDPALTMYGCPPERCVTPNQHALARQFVTLDNFYVSGAVSADGHQWLTQAMTTDYLERAHAIWPRSYPYSGEDPLAFAPSGFIWNRVTDGKLAVRIFGEFTGGVGPYSHSWQEYLDDAEAPVRSFTLRSAGTFAALQPLVEPDYPYFDLNVPDVFRARMFLDWFAARAELPNLIIVQLPSDHTSGTAPGVPTPAAMVADNDLAVGRIVDAISHSRYWRESAILITEDDAQNGPDHIDLHRTLCLLVSPFVRRGSVDSIQYNQTSVLRTIEELLRLSPMNKFDAAALPMRSAFLTTADLTPFTAVPNSVPLGELNPPASALVGEARRAALDSAAMDFTRPDAVPEERLNEILWHAARGWNVAYPKLEHARKAPPERD